ncbi:MAG: D-glycero-beta-D-manno-heptose-7-phosphate kinase [Candidatus Omnitrophica bacterium]|nr:D-glycero-beta-D-manno-heptose-7-phosphate kinase [Candidatus Omnitrophota bacterium]
MKLSSNQLQKIPGKFKGKKVLVVGDLILDHYIFGDAERISPEAPVPVVWANKESFVGGGAVNVALNLIDLGARVSLCGVVGNDHFGKVLVSLVKGKGIDTGFVAKDRSRPTTLKSRVVAVQQQVVRIDWESQEFLPLSINSRVLDRIKKSIHQFDGVIIEDYGKGVINPSLVDQLVRICKKYDKIITVDPKEEHFDYYENVTAMTPNLKEAQIAGQMTVRSKEQINLLGEVIMDRFKLKGLLITMGKEGMRLFLDNGKSFHIPTYALEVYDVTGAGDTVVAVFTLALLSGASYLEAAVIANFAAGVVVGKLGAATATKDEIIQRIKKNKDPIYLHTKWKL